MDIDSDSDESHVDAWSGGIPGGIPQTTAAAPEADDHKSIVIMIQYLGIYSSFFHTPTLTELQVM
jgi:hypothetical protein